MGFSAAEVSRDAFLDGRIEILQPRFGFRASTDAVLLAAAVDARQGQAALELGCGAGVALLSLGCRVPDLHLNGLERQADYADLARRNAAENGIPATIWQSDLTTMPAQLRAQSFDHVLANPPYYPPSATPARDPGRDGALREATPLAVWIDVGVRRLRDGGYLTLIHRADRLPDILSAFQGRVGAVTVRPLASRAGRTAGRVLVQARKGARAPFRLLSPLILHSGVTHMHDGDDYSSEARAILRDAAALDWR